MNNIIVYALGRSGSNWLVKHLAKTTGLTVPDQVIDGEIYNHRYSQDQRNHYAQQVIQQGNRIVKILSSQIPGNFSEFHGHCQHVYFNARKNLVDSVLSWYVAKQTQIVVRPDPMGSAVAIGWHRNFSEPEPVAFDASLLKTTTHACLASRKTFIHTLHNYTNDNYSLVFTEDLPQHEKLHRPVILERHDEVISYIQQYESQDPISLYQHYDSDKILKFDN